jgi:hypothetical protein
MSFNMMLRTHTSGDKIEVESGGRFIMLGQNGDLVALTKPEAIETARALLDAAGIKPTPIAQGCDSYVLPPPGEG